MFVAWIFRVDVCCWDLCWCLLPEFVVLMLVAGTCVPVCCLDLSCSCWLPELVFIFAAWICGVDIGFLDELF